MDYRVIKENDLFLLTDLSGDVAENNNGTNDCTRRIRAFLASWL